MLDKSVAWHSIIMSREDAPITVPAIPEGFVLHPYRDERDAMAWAQIETSVLEFDAVLDGVKCHQMYMPHVAELQERQWFIDAPDGTPAATATAWWGEYNGKVLPVVHALGCDPRYQGLGLGKAVAARMVQAFHECHPGQTAWLDTQTWSWKAVGLYMMLGFRPMRTAVYSDLPNDYELSLPILKEKLDEKAFKQFVDSTI